MNWLIGSLEYIFLAGVFALVLGVLFWLTQLVFVRIFRIVSTERAWTLKIWPALLISVGIIGITLPAAITHFVPPDLGPHDVQVDGERCITLTGWDRNDYSVLVLVPDARVLQMANEDVTNETLKFLTRWGALRELDVAGSQVTDEGLRELEKHTHLEKLILSRTRITDAGLQPLLSHLPQLKQLDVRDTTISPGVLRAWLKSQPGRRASPRVSLEEPPAGDAAKSPDTAAPAGQAPAP